MNKPRLRTSENLSAEQRVIPDVHRQEEQCGLRSVCCCSHCCATQLSISESKVVGPREVHTKCYLYVQFSRDKYKYSCEVEASGHDEKLRLHTE